MSVRSNENRLGVDPSVTEIKNNELKQPEANPASLKFITQTELLRLFNPEESFIEQCKIIKGKRETFFERRGNLYGFPKELKPEKKILKNDLF